VKQKNIYILLGLLLIIVFIGIYLPSSSIELNYADAKEKKAVELYLSESGTTDAAVGLKILHDSKEEIQRTVLLNSEFDLRAKVFSTSENCGNIIKEYYVSREYLGDDFYLHDSVTPVEVSHEDLYSEECKEGSNEYISCLKTNDLHHNEHECEEAEEIKQDVNNLVSLNCDNIESSEIKQTCFELSSECTTDLCKAITSRDLSVCKDVGCKSYAAWVNYLLNNEKLCDQLDGGAHYMCRVFSGDNYESMYKLWVDDLSYAFFASTMKTKSVCSVVENEGLKQTCNTAKAVPRTFQEDFIGQDLLNI